jgi:uracil-DNA glycosylase family 4
VLGENNGDVEANILFIAEAPGRFGADRTGIPLYGDKTGSLFQKMLDIIGWNRERVFITNSVICNPRDERGNNAPPTMREIENCSIYLNILIDIIQPYYVITLGNCALRSLNYISPHNFEMKKDVRKFLSWNSRILIPLYHPGPRARIYRDMSHQLSDYYALKELLELYCVEKETDIKSKKRQQKQQQLFEEPFTPTMLQQLSVHIIKKFRTITKFKLTKLIYLIDYEFYKVTGRLLTEAFYIYQRNGPLQTTLTKRLDELEGFEVRKNFAGLYLTYNIGPNIRFEPTFNSDEKEIIEEILNKFEKYNNKEIKIAAYMTNPMKSIIRLEKRGVKVLNKPVFRELIKD